MTTPVLVKAVKAQRAALVEVQNRVEAVFERLAALDRYNAALLAQLNELAARVDSLAGTGGGWDTTGGTRDSLDKYVLAQSVPNPTTAAAIIPYETPAGCTANCSICFHQLAGPGATPGGPPCHTVAITQHGPGAVVVPEAALQPGVYMYSLRVNGETLRVRYLVRTE